MARGESRGGGYDKAIEKKGKKQEALRTKTREAPTRSFLGNLIGGGGASAPVERIAPRPGADPQAPESIGELMTPTTGREPPPSSVDEFDSRVQRNKSFLQSPDTQLMLAQFGQSLLGGSDIGDALTSAVEAPRRLHAAQSKAAHQQWEDRIKLGEYRLSQQKFLAQQEQDRLAAEDRARGLDISQGQLDVSTRSQQWDEEKYWRDLREGRPKAAADLAKVKQDIEQGDLAKEETQLDIDKKRRDAHDFDRIEKLRASLLPDADEATKAEIDAMNPDMVLNAAGRLAAGGDIDGANALVQIANAKGANMTTDVKNYLAAVKDGSWTVEQGLAGWVRMQAQAGAAPPTAAMTPDGKVITPQMQEAGLKADSEAQAMGTQIRDLEFLKQVAAETPTGWTVPYTKTLKAALYSFGINLDREDYKSLVLQEVFNKETNKLALLLRNPEGGYGLPGNASNQDLNFLVSSVPNLENTPDANKAIIIVMLARQRLEAMIAAAKSKYIFDHGTLGSGWSSPVDPVDGSGGGVLEHLITNADIVSPEEQAYIDGLVHPDRVPHASNGGGDTTPAHETPTKPDSNADIPMPEGLDEVDQENWSLYDDVIKQAIINQHDAAKAEAAHRGVQ